MLLPLKDDNPLKRIPFQYVTVATIATCVAVFLWQLSLGPRGGQQAVYAYGVVPAVLFGFKDLPPDVAAIPEWLTLITSMFLHGGWMHLIGNMLFLWVLGDNVEDSMGHVRFVIFYVLSGIAAGLAQSGLNPESTVPMIGASGAISGVIGAYLMLHPKAPIHTLVFRFIVKLPAFVVLGFWIVFQLISASIASNTGGGVAWWAHIGGFVAGAILIIPMRHRDVPLFDGHGPFAHSGSLARRHDRSSVPDSGRWRR
ncbi:MAG: rhomboid family intramembrane serine protease [Rhodospirillales bacterium]|nr:rhomboid family intramembrane serine protease [Rhodospirillales bacterium]